MVQPIMLRGSAALLFALSSFAHAQPSRSAPELATSAAVRDDRESLEDLLKRLEAKREAKLAKLQGRLDPLLEKLNKEIDGKSSKKMTAVREEIEKLGLAVAPLLASQLDPGPDPERKAAEYSRQISRTLVKLPTTSITDELLAMASHGTPNGKTNALRVLAVSLEPARVSPRLIELYKVSEGAARAALLDTIAQLGGEDGDQILNEVLLGKDEELRAIALDAIITAGAPQFDAAVLKLLADLDTSADYAAKLTAYYANCPDLVGKDHTAAMISAAIDSRVKSQQRVAILRILPRFERWIDSRMKRNLKSLQTPGNRQVEQQAQILLAILGDSRARKKLLKRYDDAIDDNGENSTPYVERGTILYQIGEYSQALRDFKDAIKLSREELKSVPLAFEFGARCYARLGKLSQAADLLEKAPIGIKQLQALASDPVFRELRDSRYGRVFRLDD